MHITYHEPSTQEQGVNVAPAPPPKATAKRQGVWAMVRFVVVTGLIFGVTFFTINFGAYKDILASVIDPGKQEQAQELLEEAARAKVDPDKLLPTLQEKPEIRKEYAWLDFPVIPTDYRLVIPKLGKNVPMVSMGTENIDGKNWTELEKQIQKGLQDGAVHYPRTAKPGEYGNLFITGHSSYYAWDKGKFKDLFALLHKLEIGDQYYVYYQGKQYVYEVYKKYEVYPDNISILEQPENEKISTIMTCAPVGTALRRLVINAKDITDEGKTGPKLPLVAMN